MPQVSEEEAYMLKLRIRNAYLEDEIGRLRKAIETMVKDYLCNGECDDEECLARIARKALSE